jgi:hypothetical protein
MSPQAPIKLVQEIETLFSYILLVQKKKLPHYVPTVWPFPSKNSRKVFLTTGAVHFSCLLVILAAEVRKSRYVKVVVGVRVLQDGRVVSVL